ncbi:MAG: hypothetical protein IKL99_02135, partial [Oscillospiraceae bacterium]|nr:hypothetical protein [Oscillospiraceae bacterium]
KYENGEILLEQGKIYFTASVRMQEGSFQGMFSWIPGTAELDMTGAVFYDCGDGKWRNYIAPVILYHREKKVCYLWVCAFSHGHIPAHAILEGDPRFGVNIVDVKLLENANEDDFSTSFLGFEGDEDPDFYYNEQEQKWYMSICRLDPSTRAYRYHFFCSDHPFDGYVCIGKGFAGAETGGSFVKLRGETVFVCGNGFDLRSNYRIYGKEGMREAEFDFPDGGFRGWGTIIPVSMGSRKRYFWLTFDRHLGSDYNWSYGNVYCFEMTE